MPYEPIFDTTALTVGGDTAYDADGDAYDGSALKVEPSAGQLAQGIMRPGRQIGAQHFNWLTQQFALVMTALINNDVAHEVTLATHTADILDHENRVDVIENWILNISPRIRIYTYLTSGTFVVPARCVALLGYGCGGGGGGGKGANGINTQNRWLAGAGGGGGALASMQPIGLDAPPVPGETLNVDVGAGGAQQFTNGSTGNDGGDSIVRRGSVNLAVWRGAQGGRGAVGGHSLQYWVHYSAGGAPVRGTPVMLIGPAGRGIRWDTATGGHAFGDVLNGGPHTIYIPVLPAQGGWGAGGSTNPASSAGNYNPVGSFAPGAAGTKGVDGDPNNPPGTVDMRGGGGGGGGGAGPFGIGGYGGSGTHGEAQPSASGDDAPANSGGGGGGSGSSGYADITNFPNVTGSRGGAGGSGRVYIISVENSP